MAYKISEQYEGSIKCLAEWYRRTGNTKEYNKTVMRFNLGLELLGYDIDEIV